MKLKILLLYICLVLLILIDPLSIISMVSFLCLGLLFTRIFFKVKDYYEYTFIFSIYTIIAIVIYWTNLAAFPLNFGCTGSEISGTDDLFFFQEATNNGFSYRGDRSSFMHNYSILLEKIHLIISTYKKTNLIDLMFLNIFFHSYIPVFCKKITFFFTKNKKASKLAFLLAVCSPFLIQHSLVLVRDGITAALFIGIFYFYLNKKYLLALCFFILLSYLRLLTGGLTFLFILGYIYFTGNKSVLLKYVLFFSLIGFMFLPLITINLDRSGVISEGIFRQSYFEYIKDGAKSGSGAVAILSLPTYLRIPLGTLYFIGTPFLNLKDTFSVNFIYLWPKISAFYSLFFVFYIVYFVRAFFAKKKHILNFLLLAFIILAVLFSQISLELRHKTLIMPLLFIIVAISYHRKSSKIVRLLSFFTAFIIVVLQLGFNLINFFN